MVNVYDTANQLQEDLRKTQEFAALKEAFEELKKDEEAFNAFQDLRRAQMELQKREEAGTLGDIKPEEAKAMHEKGQKAASYDTVKKLMEKERALSATMDEINKIIFTPITELYES